eukprot:XP_016661912.1 PREDICTED: uncharacterized protein LOC107884422 [Acyrthosiphon pisum]
MVKNCIICGNVEDVDDVSVHCFPANVDRKRQWVMFAENNGVNPRQILAHSKLCSRHFVAGRDYYGVALYRRRLTAGAVPSVANITMVNNCIICGNVEDVDDVSVHCKCRSEASMGDVHREQWCQSSTDIGSFQALFKAFCCRS